MKISKFCEKRKDKELTQVTFKADDTLIVINLQSKDRAREFKNQLIADALDMFASDGREVSWNEIDNLVARINRQKIIFI